VFPALSQVQHVTHVILAFLRSDAFNDDMQVEWPTFLDVKAVRQRFSPDTKVMVAIGGWGDTAGFEAAASTGSGRKRFATNVARMLELTRLDGVDVDWEYPGGNGEDYKQVPNEQKTWQTDAFPLLLAEIRMAVGSERLISAAVPGRLADMMAFTRKTVPRIMNHVDFLNVMTYDLMNRRDNITMHHSAISNSLVAVDAYISAGAAPKQLNLGFGFYVKWFKTEHEDCAKGNPVGCRTVLMEDPNSGADLGKCGAFAWHDDVPRELEQSFSKALQHGRYDEKHGGYYYWDEGEDIWWTFDTADAISRKFPAVVATRRLGGVFAWGLGEDAPLFEHLEAVNLGIEGKVDVPKDEL